MKSKPKKDDTFLGVVGRDGSIFIPWRGTNVSIEHNFDPGQNLIVELEIKRGNIIGRVIKAELPTLNQLAQMKAELWSNWYRLVEIFRTAPMRQKVLMLRALDQAMRAGNWEN